MYFCGEHYTQDYLLALEWYLKSVNQGNQRAQYNVVNMYFSVQGVSRDYSKALFWYQRTIYGSILFERREFGVLYDDGFDVVKGDVPFMEQVLRDFENGELYAKATIASIHERGGGGKVDIPKAL